MGKVGVHLAIPALLNHTRGIFSHCWPIVPYTKGLNCDGSSPLVTPTCPLVYFSEDIGSFLRSQAAEEGVSE